MNEFRRWLYVTARLIGDINAVASGPTTTAARVGRKTIWRTIASIMRSIGL